MATRSWNRVELMGNLTRDPELRFTPNGAAVCTFGLATNRVYVTDGERKEDVDFHQIVSWNKLAELCNQLLKKGSRVFVSGRLQYREWDTPEGQKRRVAEIVVEDMIQLTPRSEMPVADEDVTPTSETSPQAPAKSDSTSEKATAKTKESTPPADKSEDTTPAPAASENVDESDLPF